LDNPGCHSG